jgi:transcription elongation factor Elf1
MASTDRRGDFDPDEDAGKRDEEALGTRRRFDEFECPSCTAYNPVGDGFGNNDDLFCNSCGQSFRAQVNDEGGLRLKET